MTQDEKWTEKFNEVKYFIETNHRNPSKYDDSERGMYVNWLRHNRKLFYSGEIKEPRLTMFKELLTLTEQYRRKNQYE